MTCPECRFEIPEDATRCGHCGAKLTHTFRNIALCVGGAFLFMLVMGIMAEVSKSPEEVARERARDCVHNAQFRLMDRGLSRGDAEAGAIMACVSEIGAVNRYTTKTEPEPARPPSPEELRSKRKEIDTMIQRRKQSERSAH